MSMPFLRKQFTFTQPDGSKIQVRGWGNQNQAIFETLDGFTVVRDPITGYYQYADVTADGNNLLPTGFQAEIADPRNLGLAPGIRTNRIGAGTPSAMRSGLPPRITRWETRREITRMRQRNALMALSGIAPAPPQRQTIGNFVGLCLLVEFPDVPATIHQAEVEAFCNQPGYNNFGNNGSVNDYFFDNSGGRLRYTNIVAPYYTAKHNRDYYTDPNQPYGDRAQELIREILDHLVTIEFDFTEATVDNDGFIFATNIFYVGDVINNWSEGLWPHAYRLFSDYQLMPGMVVADYQITNMGNELTLGTFCHENGHMVCDFPDLYDYGNDSFQSHGIGSFCLMCAGGNIDPKNPTQINAYLKYRAGWADSVTNITPGLNATIRAGTNEFYIHRKNLQEYFIIENRQKNERDLALPGSGLVIWHVDELGSNENQGMTSTLHYECSLKQADGRNDLEFGRTPFGDAQDLFFEGGNSSFGNLTNPHSRWWDGMTSGLDLSNISTSGESMTFNGNIM